jgi:hypothetical protein
MLGGHFYIFANLVDIDNCLVILVDIIPIESLGRHYQCNDSLSEILELFSFLFCYQTSLIAKKKKYLT